MTIDTHDSEPYHESKDHVLSHYFDELLPDNTRNDDVKPESADVKAQEPPPAQHPSADDSLDSIDDDHSEMNQAEPLQSVEAAAQFMSPSESLQPLSDIPSIVNDSTAYQAHKQKLENMLKQLNPANPLPSLLESQEIPAELDGGDIKSETLTVSSSENESTIEAQTDDAQPLLHTSPLSSTWLDNGRPNWAQDPFDILLIDVHGLKLALPLVSLGHIEPIEEDLTPLFGQAQWFLGIQKTPFGNIKAIDTAQYVMPEKTSLTNEKGYQFVVSISGINWGLAVDSIDQPIKIDPEAIRWRVKRTNRPWMAGTVKDHMCVLLDIPVMGQILQKEDQNHRNPTGE